MYVFSFVNNVFTKYQVNFFFQWTHWWVQSIERVLWAARASEQSHFVFYCTSCPIIAFIFLASCLSRKKPRPRDLYLSLPHRPTVLHECTTSHKLLGGGQRALHNYTIILWGGASIDNFWAGTSSSSSSQNFLLFSSFSDDFVLFFRIAIQLISHFLSQHLLLSPDNKHVLYHGE